MYLNYYRKNEMQPDDNPPVGILMCTEVGAETVEYATAGLDQQLFISKYGSFSAFNTRAENLC